MIWKQFFAELARVAIEKDYASDLLTFSMGYDDIEKGYSEMEKEFTKLFEENLYS